MATKFLLFSSVFLCMLTLCLLISVMLSAKWKILDIDTNLIKRLIRADQILNMNATHKEDDINVIWDHGIVLCIGIARITVLIGPITHDIPTTLVSEGAYAATGFSIFAVGLIMLQSTGFLMDIQTPQNSSSLAKGLASGCSAFLRIGCQSAQFTINFENPARNFSLAGILLAGMVVYTIIHVKQRNENDHFGKILVEMMRDLQLSFDSKYKRYQLKEIKKIDQEFSTDVEQLRFQFGWCFIVGWVAAGLSLVASVLAWAVSIKVNRRRKRVKKRVRIIG